MSFIGYPIGILIGIVSGVVFISLITSIIQLLTSVKKSGRITQRILFLITQILSLPVFWFGGSWFTTNERFFEDVNIKSIQSSYLLSLTLTFSLIVFVPLTRYIIRSGNIASGQERNAHD